jgi:hypothetical protein
MFIISTQWINENDTSQCLQIFNLQRTTVKEYDKVLLQLSVIFRLYWIGMTQNKILSTNFSLENKYKITFTCIKWFYKSNMQMARWINRHDPPIMHSFNAIYIKKKTHSIHGTTYLPT